MLGALAIYAQANQAVLVTPFIMAGAMSPAATAGSIAQLNAEVTAGIAYAQLVRPGAPMVYGNFVTAVSMQSGAPMMGGPEPAMMIYVTAQLARIRQNLQLIDHKINVYRGRLAAGDADQLWAPVPTA